MSCGGRASRGLRSTSLTTIVVKAMRNSDEAIDEQGRLKWLGERPNIASARVIVTVLAESSIKSRRRSPPPSLVGKVEILGDIVSPLVDEDDWECLNPELGASRLK